MTDFDHQIDALLEGAWQGAAPRAGDLERIQALVRERVASAPNDPGDVGRASSSARGSGRGWPRLLPQAATAAERARLLGWGSLIAGVAFLLGVGYGRPRELPPAHVPAVSISPALPSQRVSAPDSPLPAQPPLVLEPAAELAPSAPPPEPPAAVPPDRTSRAAPRGQREHSSARATAAATLGFDAVLALLDRAERALRRSEPAIALSLLDQIDERADPETLHDERLVTRVLATCALGDVDAARRAGARLQRSSGSASIYASRLSETCIAAPAPSLDAIDPAPAHDRSDSR